MGRRGFWWRGTDTMSAEAQEHVKQSARSATAPGHARTSEGSGQGHMDLISFVKARLDEDEATASTAMAVAAPPWRWAEQSGPLKYGLVGDHPVQAGQDAWVVPSAAPDIYPHRDTAAHIARHDPARVLREVEVKRRLLDWLDQIDQWLERDDLAWHRLEGAVDIDHARRLLALPYADHEDFKEEWRV